MADYSDGQYTDIQHKVLEHIRGHGSECFINPEKELTFGGGGGVKKLWEHCEDNFFINPETEKSFGDRKAELWKHCEDNKLIPPDRSTQIFSKKSQMQSYYRMVVFEVTISCNLGYLIAAYVLEQDQTSEAVLSSSNFVLKDVAKLHQWVISLRKHLEKRTKECLDVRLFSKRESSDELYRNLKMSSSISNILNALIQRKNMELRLMSETNDFEHMTEAASRKEFVHAVYDLKYQSREAG